MQHEPDRDRVLAGVRALAEAIGADPQQAVSTPRFHCEQDGRLYLEPGFPDTTVAALQQRGYETIRTSYMGCNQAIALRGGALVGGSDPRGGVGIATVP